MITRNTTKERPLFAPIRSEWTRTDKHFTCLSYPSADDDELHRLARQATCMLCAFTPLHWKDMWFTFISQVSHYHVQLYTTAKREIYFLYCLSIVESCKTTPRELHLPSTLLVRTRFAGFFTCALLRYKKGGCEQPKENKNCNTI